MSFLRKVIIICLVLSYLIAGAQTNHPKEFTVNIEKIDSKKFSFLRECVGNKKYVLIGESTHGVREFGEFKTEAVEYLVDSLGFSAIFLESGLSDILKWTNGKQNYDSLVYSLFPIWHTSSYLKLFQFIEKRGIKVYGIDPQNSSRFYRDFPYQELLNIDKDLAISFNEIDQEWSKIYSKPLSSWDSTFYSTKQKAIDIYGRALNRVLNLDSSKLVEHIYLKRILENRLSITKNISVSADMFHRDSIMKDNIDWLIKKVLKKDEKAIVLSHNAHVAREKSFDIGYLGCLMTKDYNDDIFVIGQYFESGKFMNNRREILEMPLPERNSLEAYLSQFKGEFKVFDLRSPLIPQKIFNKKIKTYYMGGAMVQSFNLSKNYDMIFTVKHANLPQFVD